jgi:hypothetical protein
LDSKNEWAIRNCKINTRFTTMAYGQGTVPRLSLKPKNIAAIIARMAVAKVAWHTTLKANASKMRRAPAGG